MSRQQAGRGPGGGRAAPAIAAPRGAPGGPDRHGRDPETRDRPRRPQASPSLPPPGAHHDGGDDGQQRVAVGQQPVRCLRAAARLRPQPGAALPRRGPRSRHGPGALRGGGASPRPQSGGSRPLPLRGGGTLLSETMGWVSVSGRDAGRPAAEAVIRPLRGLPVHLSFFRNSILNLVALTVLSTPARKHQQKKQRKA